MLTALLIRSGKDCVIETAGAFLRLSPELPAVLPFMPDGDRYFTVWGSSSPSDGKVSVPRVITVTLREGRAVKANAPTADWGGLVEILAEPVSFRLPRYERPRVLGSAELNSEEGRVKAELCLDGGLAAVFTRRDGRRECFSLGEGRDGSIRTLDLGSGRVLAVTADTDLGRRLVIVNTAAEILLDVCGDSAGISDGFPCVTEELGVVRGYARRTRYEFRKGGFVPLESETGYFERQPREPANDAEKALSIAEDVLFGREEWRSLVSEELLSRLDGASPADFLGEYEEARLFPAEEAEGRVTVGLLSGGGLLRTPRKFVFVMEDGLLSDVVEM